MVLQAIVSRERSSGCTNEENLVSHFTQTQHFCSRSSNTLTALDLNADGTRLTSASLLKGPDKELWEKAHGEEIVRLIESGTGRFIHRHEMLADRKAAYYNSQCKIKVKPDGIQFVVPLVVTKYIILVLRPLTLHISRRSEFF